MESHAGDGAGWPAPKQVLDNRDLQPPEPMVRILSALEQLAAGEVIEAWNDREPLLLYPELEARGAAIQVQPGGLGRPAADPARGLNRWIDLPRRLPTRRCARRCAT